MRRHLKAMRLTKHVILCLVAACALGALFVSSASATLPEIGRCVKLEGVKEGHKTIYKGKFTNKKCTKTSQTEKGKFEWLPGAGEEKGFESPGTLEPATLETPSGAGVECKNSKMFGEYTGANTEKVEISLFECLEKTSKKFCQSVRPEEVPPAPQEGTVISLPLEGKLGFINAHGSRPQVGWEYKPKTGPFLFAFECGQTTGAGTKISIEGAFIGQVWHPVDKMVEEYFLRNIGSRGKQTPEMFEGGAVATMKATIVNPTSLEETTEPISYSAPVEEQSTSEELEIKAKA